MHTRLTTDNKSKLKSTNKVRLNIMLDGQLAMNLANYAHRKKMTNSQVIEEVLRENGDFSKMLAEKELNDLVCGHPSKE